MPQRLAQHLISRGLLSAKIIDEAMKRIQLSPTALDTVLLEMGAISEAGMLQALSDVSGLRMVNLSDFEANLDAAPMLPLKISRRLTVVPLSVDGGKLHLAVGYPAPHKELREVAFLLGKELELWVALECRIRDWQASLYKEQLAPRYLKLLKTLDPARAARIEAEANDEPGGLTESVSLDVIEKLARGVASDQVTLAMPSRQQKPSPKYDETVVLDAAAYSAYAKPSPGASIDEFHATTVLDTSGYANFAKQVSAAPSSPNPRRPGDKSPTEPEMRAVVLSNDVTESGPSPTLSFPGGVMPPKKPGAAKETPRPTHKEVRAVERAWVQPAPPPRPPAEKLRPQRAPPQPAPAPARDETDFSDLAPSAPQPVPQIIAQTLKPIGDIGSAGRSVGMPMVTAAVPQRVLSLDRPAVVSRPSRPSQKLPEVSTQPEASEPQVENLAVAPPSAPRLQADRLAAEMQAAESQPLPPSAREPSGAGRLPTKESPTARPRFDELDADVAAAAPTPPEPRLQPLGDALDAPTRRGQLFKPPPPEDDDEQTEAPHPIPVEHGAESTLPPGAGEPAPGEEVLLEATVEPAPLVPPQPPELLPHHQGAVPAEAVSTGPGESAPVGAPREAAWFEPPTPGAVGVEVDHHQGAAPAQPPAVAAPREAVWFQPRSPGLEGVEVAQHQSLSPASPALVPLSPMLGGTTPVPVAANPFTPPAPLAAPGVQIVPGAAGGGVVEKRPYNPWAPQVVSTPAVAGYAPWPTSPSSPQPQPSAPGLGRNPSPIDWSLPQARAALRFITQDRDSLVRVVLEYGRRAFDFVAAFAVLRGAATGWDAVGDGDTQAIRSIAIPLDAASVFRTVALTRGSYVGPLPPDALTQHYLALLGRAPRAVFLWPVEVKGRLVAMLYGDSGNKPVSQRRLNDFILFCQELPAAFHELIVFRKQQGAGHAFSAPDQMPQAPQDTAPAGETPDADFMQNVIALLTGPDPRERIEAMNELYRTPEASAQALARNFPGPTGWSRLPVVELPDPDELGPIPGALARLGHAGALAVAPLLDSDDSDTRYLALLTAGALRDEVLFEGVLRGLFDLEPDISSAARAAATAMKPLPEFPYALQALRQELGSRDPLRKSLAARALGVLHDREAIDGLIDLCGSEDPLCAQSASEALREITRMNFGPEPAAWRTWLAAHRGQRRIEWLVNALASDEFDARLAAIEELSRALGDNLGFFADGSEKERSAGVERWRAAIAARPEAEL